MPWIPAVSAPHQATRMPDLYATPASPLTGQKRVLLPRPSLVSIVAEQRIPACHGDKPDASNRVRRLGERAKGSLRRDAVAGFHTTDGSLEVHLYPVMASLPTNEKPHPAPRPTRLTLCRNPHHAQGHTRSPHHRPPRKSTMYPVRRAHRRANSSSHAAVLTPPIAAYLMLRLLPRQTIAPSQ